jgi:hypothetical protein
VRGCMIDGGERIGSCLIVWSTVGLLSAKDKE